MIRVLQNLQVCQGATSDVLNHDAPMGTHKLSSHYHLETHSPSDRPAYQRSLQFFSKTNVREVWKLVMPSLLNIIASFPIKEDIYSAS